MKLFKEIRYIFRLARTFAAVLPRNEWKNIPKMIMNTYKFRKSFSKALLGTINHVRTEEIQKRKKALVKKTKKTKKNRKK